jgi:signal peptidase I
MIKSQDIKAADRLNFFKLSYPPNKKIPFIANCLELRTDEKYGRYIITNRLLKTGDVVAIEEPIYKVIKADSRYNTCYESNRYQRCANCLMDNLLDLIPCSNCCASKLFLDYFNY